MTPKEDEKERREIVRRLEHEYRAAQAKKLQVDPDLTQEIAEIDAKLLRAKAPLEPDFCPVCFAEEAVKHRLLPQSSAYGVDTFRCGRCGYEVERKA